MLSELLKASLLLVVSFAVKAFFTFIKVDIDEATFNAIVAGAVAVLLALFGLDVARAAIAKSEYAGLLVQEQPKQPMEKSARRKIK